MNKKLTFTNAQVIDKLKEVIGEDCAMADKADVETILDYLSMIGVEGASNAYCKLLKDKGIA